MNIYRNYKIYLTVIISFLAINGCTNLDEEVYDQISAANYGTTDKQINSIIAPIYRTLKDLFPGNYYRAVEVSSDMTVLPTRKGGDYWDGGKNKELKIHTWTSNNSVIQKAYASCMSNISICNQIYSTIENNKASVEDRAIVLAEIRGVRAFWYYILIDNWGNVPIATDFTETSNPSTKSRKEVYEFIMSELNDIKDLVRTDVSSSSYGKITKGVVYTLLAKMYLNTSIWNPDEGAKWAECAEACDAVMNLDYILEPDWQVNFQVHNEISKEIIFPIVFSAADEGNRIASRTLHYLDPIALGLNIEGWNGFSAMPAYVKSFDLDDKRKAWTFLTGAMLDPSTGDTLITAHGRPLIHTEDIEMKYNIDDDGWGYAEQEDGARCIKWEFESGLSTDMENDFAIFRLADVYLMKAEALVRMNKDNAEATRLVNEIRKRAFDNSSKLKSSVVLDDIYMERRFELGWEGFGRQDQIRFGTFLDAIPGWKEESDSKYLLFSIPQNALDANPLLIQNPGY